jgi:hypothetical protein
MEKGTSLFEILQIVLLTNSEHTLTHTLSIEWSANFDFEKEAPG